MAAVALWCIYSKKLNWQNHQSIFKTDFVIAIIANDRTKALLPSLCSRLFLDEVV
jgi:hypothetical protein